MPPRTFGPLSTTRYTANGVSFDTIRVPPGRLVDGEGAKKRALLNSRPFEIGTTLVTQALWRAVTGESPSRVRVDGCPVAQVSWYDIQAFLVQLESLGLRGFRLPTEAEWAWAARCGSGARWAGADRFKLVAVVAGQAQAAAPVGSLLSSAAGALDFSGNLWEWQQDVWQFGVPAGGVDLEGPPSGSYRVYRGGSWGDISSFARVSDRDSIGPDYSNERLGLRLARTTP
jgi:formylglycine-generating enzyme required for sulfatase activity